MTSDIFDPLESFSQWTSLIKLLKFYFPYRWYFSIFLKIFSRLNLIENPSHIYIRQFKRNNKFNNLRSSTNHPSTLSTNIFRSSEKSFPKWTSLKIVTFIFANFYSTSVIFSSSENSFPGWTFIENPSHIYIPQFKPVITNNPRDISRCSFRISFPLNSRVATWSKDRIFQFNVAANANAPILAWN